MSIDFNEKPARAIVVAVQLPSVSDEQLQVSVNELRELAKTLGFDVVGSFFQKRSSFDTAAYLGLGKRQELRRFVEGDEGGVDANADAELAETDGDESDDDGDDKANETASGSKAPRSGAARAKLAAKSEANPLTRRADVLLVDHEISPSQARNLEIEVGCEVMDRTMVILEIFHRHASSRSARAQVEIARLGYMAPRLREAAKLAGPKGRQRSGVGGRGAGEAHSDLDRKKIRDRIAELQLEIKALDAERQTQRARRQERQGIARVTLVGYTNAGKSTLMHALTGSEAYIANQLFATLDTTVRALSPQTVPRILLSDTVGFIKNLPHDLVASFKSTLEEAAEASLLLHVVDASDLGYENQIRVTQQVLADIDALSVPRLMVFNKIDNLEPQAAAAQTRLLQDKYPECVVMSAVDKADVARLHAAICAHFQRDLVEATVLLGWHAQDLRGEIFEKFQVLEETSTEEGASLRLRGEKPALKKLQQLIKKRKA